MPRSDLPFGSEFSPSQIDLARVLEMAKESGGDWKAFEDAVRVAYFDSHKTSDHNRGKLADNTKLGMIAYGLIDRSANLTPFGEHLYSIREDRESLYRELARHILLNLKGVSLVQCILDMQAAGEKVDLVRLRERLEERGIHVPRGGKHPSMMRLWLEKAGVFSSGWYVDQAKLQRVLGIDVEDVDVLAQLTPEQRYYLRALAGLDTDRSYTSNEIEKLATAVYGIKYNEKSLPKLVLYPLQAAGFIDLTRGGKEVGRGAKPFLVTATDRFQVDVFEPLLVQFENQIAPKLRGLLRQPFATVVEQLHSEDKYARGLALEALAFKLMRLVDMQYVATRLRSEATGGAEVDLIFDSSRLVFTRWQIQCKNTALVSLDDVAKEVGLSHFLKSNVIVVVGTGVIGQEARRYANQIMHDSNLCVVMMDGQDIARIVESPIAIVDVLHREAEQAMRLKELTL